MDREIKTDTSLHLNVQWFIIIKLFFKSHFFSIHFLIKRRALWRITQQLVVVIFKTLQIVWVVSPSSSRKVKARASRVGRSWRHFFTISKNAFCSSRFSGLDAHSVGCCSYAHCPRPQYFYIRFKKLNPMKPQPKESDHGKRN